MAQADQVTAPGPVGFLGVGTIAVAMISGLRRRWPGLAIHVSPRSAAASRALAERDSLIIRHETNASVVEASGVVFLTMRPPQLDEAVRGLPFRGGQVAASCVAGTSLAEVAALVEPSAVCRVLPLPMIARLEGPLVLQPSLPPVAALLDGLGDVIAAEDETAFAALMAASATMSSFFALQATIAGWMAEHGATPEAASSYVRSLQRALAKTAVRTAAEALPELIAEHETPGGINQRVRRTLEAQGWFDAVGGAFDHIASLKRGDLTTEAEGEV